MVNKELRIAHTEVGVIDDIEELRPELHVDSLGQLGLLHEREVPVEVIGVVQRVAANVTDRAIWLQDVACRIVPLGDFPYAWGCSRGRDWDARLRLSRQCWIDTSPYMFWTLMGRPLK